MIILTGSSSPVQVTWEEKGERKAWVTLSVALPIYAIINGALNKDFH